MTNLIPATIFDTFSRSVGSGSWGDADTGQTWMGETSAHSVSGGVGLVTVGSSVTGWNNAYIDLSAEGIPNQGTGEILCLVRYTGTEAFPTTDFGPTLRVSGNSYYALSLHGNWDEIAFRTLVNGVPHELIRTSKTLSKNTWYWVRFKIDTALRARIWTYGTSEPAAWTLTHSFYTGANPPTTGDFGFYHRRIGSNYNVEIRGYYAKTLEDVEPGLPVTDTFTRTQSDKWGVTDSGHVWTGPMNYDPQNYAPVGSPSTNGSAGNFSVGTTVQAVRIGPNVINSETHVMFSLNGQKGTVRVLGRASGWDTPDSNSQILDDGYYAAFLGNTNQLQVFKLVNGSATQIPAATTVALATVNLGDLWHVKLRCNGTSIQAKAWKDGSAEPGFQITATDSDITGAGSSGLRISSATGTMNLLVSTFEYTVPNITEALTTGALTAGTITDTTLILTADYSNDTDNDSTISGQYRITGSGDEWTALSPWTKNTGATTFTRTVTNLSPSTQYDFEVTFADPDGVIGTNPRSVTATTTGNSVRATDVAVVDSSTTSLDVEAYYASDVNDNSTASAEYRAVNTLQTSLSDEFADLPATPIVDHAPDTGGTWSLRTANTGITPVIRNNAATLQFDPAVAVVNQSQYLYNSTTFSSADYSVSGTIRFVDHGTSVELLGRYNNASLDYYGAGLYYTLGSYTPRWAILKAVGGTRTLLVSEIISDIQEGDSYHVSLSMVGTQLTLWVDGEQRLSTTDASVSASGNAAYRIYMGIEPVDKTLMLPVNSLLDFSTEIRTVVGAGTWTSAGAMTADRPNKKFTKNIGSLSPDTIYQVRVTFADTDGVLGQNPLSTTGMTAGTSLAIEDISISPSYTSLSVEVGYDPDSDTNGNGKVMIRYRSAQDSSFWISGVPDGTIYNDTVNNVFRTNITGLRPGTIYEVQAVNLDPDGIVEGSPLTVSANAMTLEATGDVGLLFIEKQYLWKVYDSEGTYIETWTDAGIPDFSWEEARGVSNMGVDFPRRFSEGQHTRSSLKLENRVDLFTFAPLSNGIGPNREVDPDFSKGGWTLGSNATVVADAGPNSESALVISSVSSMAQTTRSSPIYTSTIRITEDTFSAIETVKPSEYVLSLMTRSPSGQLNVFIEAYGHPDVDGTENLIDVSSSVFSIGGSWQVLRLNYVPPLETNYLRIALRNVGAPEIVSSRVVIRSKEKLIYRGFIKEISPSISSNAEGVSVELYGLDFVLDSLYIDFLQFVNTPESRDSTKPNFGALDPGEMVKKVIDNVQRQNPTKVWLYYTEDSIGLTGELQEYVARDNPASDVLESLVDLCPPGWYLRIEPDGLVVLDGPENSITHRLNIGVEISEYEYTLSSGNRKNYIIVNGRQDDDESEPDGFGTIKAIAFDQASIDHNGKQVFVINDQDLTTPESAMIVAEGRLEEMNKDEIQGAATILDSSSILSQDTSIRGYNIESIRPGDYVTIADAVSSPNFSYWDDFLWDVGYWDVETNEVTLESLPVVKIDYRGEVCVIHLNERPPSAIGAFARYHRWLLLKEQSDLRR